MRSVNTTIHRSAALSVTFLCGSLSLLQAQTINAPYSRYGLGDLVPNQPALARGMGGISAAYADAQSVNFLNPASYARLKYTTLDFGLELENRTIRSFDPPGKFSATSPTVSYLQLAFPLSSQKHIGMNLGLRPISRINYKQERRERLTDIDSVQTLFEGHGGAYQVYAGTGIGNKRFSIGVNIGYQFGRKDYSTKQIFIPDSAYDYYYNSNFETASSFGGLFLNGGVQYIASLGKSSNLRLGAQGTLQQKMTAHRDITKGTFNYTTAGAIDTIDIVQEDHTSGKVVMPGSYGAGIIYEKTGKWMVGADFKNTFWNAYRYFGAKDSVQDSWTLQVGAQLLPAGGHYPGHVAYRAGFSIGQDYINVDGDLKNWNVSLGVGLPMRRANYTNQFSVINLALEMGQRGNKQNIIRENYFRLSVGLSLSDIWFLKRKYE